MARPAKEIVRDAIELSEPERLRVVERLLASLDAKRDRDVDAAWAEEVDARSREIKRGVVRPISWAKVRSRARRRARGPR
jgi:putative addiction module component (TIGR02574 family)